MTVGQQLVGIHLDLFLLFLPSRIMLRELLLGEGGLDTVAGVIGQRQRYRAGGSD